MGDLISKSKRFDLREGGDVMVIKVPISLFSRLKGGGRSVGDFKIACYVLNFGRRGEEVGVPFNLVTRTVGRASWGRRVIKKMLERVGGNRYEDIFEFLPVKKEHYGMRAIYVLCKKVIDDFADDDIRLIGYSRFIELDGVMKGLILLSKNMVDLKYMIRRLEFGESFMRRCLNNYHKY